MAKVNIVIDEGTADRIKKYRNLGIAVNVSRICREGINIYLDGALESKIRQIKSEISGLKDQVNKLASEEDGFKRILHEEISEY